MKNMQDKKKNEICSLVEAADLVADSAILLIIKKLMDGPKRYGEIKEYVSLVSEATLSTRLKKLVELELINRNQFNSIPPKVEYELTSKAEELKKVVDALENFGDCYLSQS